MDESNGDGALHWWHQRCGGKPISCGKVKSEGNCVVKGIKADPLFFIRHIHQVLKNWIELAISIYLAVNRLVYCYNYYLKTNKLILTLLIKN
jgi:hypothetical protein